MAERMIVQKKKKKLKDKIGNRVVIDDSHKMECSLSSSTLAHSYQSAPMTTCARRLRSASARDGPLLLVHFQPCLSPLFCLWNHANHACHQRFLCHPEA